MYYRLIKPDWAQEFIKFTTKPNPEFVKSIDGPNTIEGYDFSEEFIKEKNELGYNVYFFPNHPSKQIEGNVKGEHINVFNYVFIDMDLKDGVYKTKQEFIDKINEFPIKPTFGIDSGNGIHVYWKIQDLNNRDRYCNLQKRLISHFKTDDSVWKVAQLMRCPGTLNTKKINNFIPVKDIEQWDTRGSYKYEDLDKLLPPITDSDKFKIQAHFDKIDGIHKDQYSDVQVDKLPEKFKLLLEQDTIVNDLFYKPKESANNDRSKADMKLCNKLFTKDFDKKEAFQVMMNTDKARTYPGNPEDYASSVVEKVYTTRNDADCAMSAEELLNSDSMRDMGTRIKGPKYWDKLKEGFKLGEVLGFIAGTGIGKTAVSIDALYHFTKNNPDYINFFFSLEMPARQIIKRWRKRCKDDKDCMSKLFVVDNRNKNKRIGWQEIYKVITDTCKVRGKKVGVVVIDHMRALSNRIDVRVKPHFDIGNSQETGWYGDIKNATEKDMCRIMDDIAEMLNCFLIVQNQSSKANAGEGDVPLGVNAAYGTTFFAWHCDYIITVWQPLKRVQNQTELTVTGWQYNKIREQDPEDKIKVGQRQAMYFDQNTNELKRLNSEQYGEFKELNLLVNKIRQMEKKGQITDHQYVEDIDEGEDKPVKLTLKRFDVLKTNE